MSFVKARKGNKVIKVSRSAYEKTFKSLGYEDVEEKKNDTFGLDFDENVDLENIPISDMTKEQLAEYAERHNINVLNAKTVGEVRKIVKREMERRRA